MLQSLTKQNSQSISKLNSQSKISQITSRLREIMLFVSIDHPIAIGLLGAFSRANKVFVVLANHLRALYVPEFITIRYKEINNYAKRFPL